MIRVDGGGVVRPGRQPVRRSDSEAVGTPAIDSGFTGDVYLTLTRVGGTGPATGGQGIPNLPAGSVAVGVVVEPLIAWMWAGGLLIGVGGLLALVPGRRRRPTDPVSSVSPVVGRGRTATPDGDGPDRGPARRRDGARGFRPASGSGAGR